MSDPLKVHVEGPLQSWVPQFRDFLVERGYVPHVVAQRLQMIAHLSGWMLVNEVSIHGLSPSVIEGFFSERRLSHRNLCSPRALIPLLDFFDGVGLERDSDQFENPSVSEIILDRFSQYLAGDRALRQATVQNYLNQTRPFLRWRATLTGEDFSTLTANEITSFLLFRGTGQSVGSVRVAATALRALLKWMFLVQITPVALAGAVGPIAYSSYGGLPRALSADQIALVAAQADLPRSGSCRNRALVLVFSRLGLRSVEAAGLRLDDINWRLGTVLVRGKGARMQTMPLPTDVGAALSDYLHRERPASPHRQVFLGVSAPHAPLTPSGVSAVITRLGRRARIGPRIGAHRLRHSAATAVINGGGTLTEAAQLLRHESITTTVIYAKADLGALRTLIRPWPDQTSSVDAAADSAVLS
jgi:integrase/recombinase XerD